MADPDLRLKVEEEVWPLAKVFTISRGSRQESRVLLVEIEAGPHRGRGECVPYPHFGESVEGVIAQIKSMEGRLAQGICRMELSEALPPGAARNALDCALWDLEAKRSGRRVWELAGMEEPIPCVCAETIGIDSPDSMAAAAEELASRALLKVKLDAQLVTERLRAVRAAAPKSRIVIDANESWDGKLLLELARELVDLNIEMVEQPLPAGKDAELAEIEFPIPICADESLHSREQLSELQDRYQMINIKLDKAGGLSEALALAEAARERGMSLMVGCMVGTSLAMAPATLIAPMAKVVDLDGPLLLASDREGGLDYRGGMVRPPRVQFWG
ncbi:MAG: N-acetyl-D-Glu racemase DgcA [Planctomycetota bacterium]|jgi:L-alanine-DL-glutamate epimerase-like enolase superfamily enzyme